MNIIKPKALKVGDTIGFLSVSGPVYELERVDKAKKYFEQKGYNVLVSDTTYMKKDFLAADDDVRLAQLHEFFADDNIDAILCTRGGYGAIRLIEKIDYNLLQTKPKIFAGFSDATAFLASISKKCGLVTYHSPMPYPDFGCDEVSKTTEKSFFEILGGMQFEAKLDGKVYHTSTAEGVLWGGNLATLASMVGTDFLPGEKFILFLEDVNEPAYKVDRYLTELSFDKNFQNNLSGIVLGEFTQLDEPDFFDNIFSALGEKLSIPIISGLKIGHVKDKITVPVGIKVRLDSQNLLLKEII